MALFGPYALVLGVAAVFTLPFLLFSLAGRFTGRHMLAFALAMFGVIIGVNIWLATRAAGTFPGLETANAYVASQSFDHDRAAQERLGWTVTPAYDGRELTLSVRDSAGNPARIRHLSATIGRPTHVREDQTPAFTYEGGLFRAPLRLGLGMWNIHLTVEAADGTVFRQRIDHYAGSEVSG
ncbi:FixH family protein [Paracoccus contaminans]|uniref:Nitrogen fixation protein FixH n=1 Tax=Paracoccus contaminans TaxID=1945662 RepID=A0A1W6CUE5_9RHOB|nr:nitrogen fixation protein FixH [Paracoccus contaminans]